MTTKNKIHRVYAIGLALCGAMAMACGPVTDTSPEGLLAGGKADGPLGNTSNAYLAAGVEANLPPTALVTKMTQALQPTYVYSHKSGFFSSTIENKELKKVFTSDADLSANRLPGRLRQHRRRAQYSRR